MKPTPAEREQLVQELVAARDDKSLSRRDVARDAGVSHTLINAVETTLICASPHVLKSYSRLCGLDLDTLLLSWGYTPPDVQERLRSQPQLCQMVRAA